MAKEEVGTLGGLRSLQLNELDDVINIILELLHVGTLSIAKKKSNKRGEG